MFGFSDDETVHVYSETDEQIYHRATFNPRVDNASGKMHAHFRNQG